MSRIRDWIDPFILLILAALVVGIVAPFSPAWVDAVSRVGDVAIVVLFFAYGLRLSTREIVGGLKNWRLQGAILLSTFLLYPLLGLGLHAATAPLVGSALAAGLLYLTLLPSTVQSSVAFVSIARGNIAGAICGATLSNIAGMLITPMLVLWLMSARGSAGFGSIADVLLHLLLPFALGQLLQPWVGGWVRRHRPLTKVLDQGTVVILVLSAVATATAEGVWQHVSALMIVALIGLSAALLAVVLTLTWWSGRLLHLGRGDRIALLMCGSKKSLATGLPMALVLFPAAAAATIAVPVIVFHQLQLVTCAWLARRLARDAPAYDERRTVTQQ